MHYLARAAVDNFQRRGTGNRERGTANGRQPGTGNGEPGQSEECGVKSAQCRVRNSSKGNAGDPTQRPRAGRHFNGRSSPQRGGGLWPRVKHRPPHGGRCRTRGNVRVTTHPPRGGGGSANGRKPATGGRRTSGNRERRKSGNRERGTGNEQRPGFRIGDSGFGNDRHRSFVIGHL